MMKLYYRIWADGIISAKKKNNDWRWLLLAILVPQMLNLATLIILIKEVFDIGGSVFYQFTYFQSKMLNSFLSAFLFMILPFTILNYFLIVHNKKYNKIIKLYEGKDGILVMKYMFISAAIFLVPIITAKFFF